MLSLLRTRVNPPGTALCGRRDPPAPDGDSAPHGGPRCEDIVTRVIGHMCRDLAARHSLDTLAEVAGCSPFTLIRAFRKLTGITPGRFLTSLRLAEAKRILLTDDCGVIHVCYEVGYESLGSFNNRFKALVGLTPTELRCRLRTMDVEKLRAANPQNGLDDGYIHAIAVYRAGAPFADLVAFDRADGVAPAPSHNTRHDAIHYAAPWQPNPRDLLLQGEVLRSACLPLSGSRMPGKRWPNVELRPTTLFDPPVLPVVADCLMRPAHRSDPTSRAA